MYYVSFKEMTSFKRTTKMKIVDIAYKMGIRTIDLYNILLNNNEYISIYLKLYLLLQK